MKAVVVALVLLGAMASSVRAGDLVAEQEELRQCAIAARKPYVYVGDQNDAVVIQCEQQMFRFMADCVSGHTQAFCSITLAGTLEGRELSR